MTLLLSNDDVAELLSMSECMAVLEEAYVELAAGRGVSRIRSDTLTPTTRRERLYGLKTMDGVVPKLGVGAVRINSDILTWPERDGSTRREKVPAAPNERYVGLVLLFSSETGEPLAIFPDGVLQRLRVGATCRFVAPASNDFSTAESRSRNPGVRPTNRAFFETFICAPGCRRLQRFFRQPAG